MEQCFLWSFVAYIGVHTCLLSTNDSKIQSYDKPLDKPVFKSPSNTYFQKLTEHILETEKEEKEGVDRMMELEETLAFRRRARNNVIIGDATALTM